MVTRARQQAQPYRWRLACDTAKPTRPFYLRYWTRKTQAERVAQAQHCWPGGLIEDRCKFGFRRLILEGEIPADSAQAVHEQARLVAHWTLYTIYGLEEHQDPWRSKAPEPGNIDLRIWKPAW